jgi:acetyltransferase-like isoleucine patch superfamily enzyme
MRKRERIEGDRYYDIEYHQFTQSRALKLAMSAAGVATWPLVLPLALLARISDFVFVTCSQLLAFAPYLLGTIMRYEFYRFTLAHCGRNVMIGFGTVLLYRDIRIGDNVLIGMYNTIHYCDFGSYVLTAEGCRFLSGAQYHNFERTDVPMALQGGKLRRINLANDCWIGANAVVMADLAQGSIVGAGAVVTKSVEPYTIVGGVPAREIGRRKPSA